MKGQHVKLIRQTGPNVHESNWMNFCEVQVYGYLYYGELPFVLDTVGNTRVDGDPVPYPLRLFQYRLLSERQCHDNTLQYQWNSNGNMAWC